MAMIGKFSSYSFIDTNVFSAMQSRLNNRSNEALAEEERQDKSNGLTNITTLMRANNVRVSDNLNQTSDSVVVMFNDPKTDERITLNLSQENLDKLKTQFGADDFYTREDGVIRLNNKAEAFVSGWFGDIAYQQNYVAADVDKSGRVSGEELREIKGYRVSGVYDAKSVKETSLNTYVALGNDFAQRDDDESIEERLNYILERDKNFDGQIERISEAEGGLDELIKSTDKLLTAFDGAETNTSSNPLDSNLSNTQSTNTDWKKKFEELKKLREELDEQFAKQAEKAKERLEQMNEKAESKPEVQPRDSLKLDNPELSSVVDEIRLKVASNDVQLFEVRA